MPSANDIILIVLEWWPVWLPFILLFIFWDVWVRYVRTHYIASLEWVLLEIKIPREIAKSPKAMESFLAGIHGTGRTGDLITRYWQGFQRAWFSLEIVGDETGVHFYVWTQTFFKKMIEAQIYAQYPNVEIVEVEDYTSQVPGNLPSEEWEVWGTDMVLAKPDAYPIRTYEDFPLEDISLKEEERKIDPLAALIEFLGNLNEGEKFWMQIIIRPAGDDWKKAGEQLVAKLVGRKVESPKPWPVFIVDSVEKLIFGILGIGSATPEKKEDKPMSFMLLLSPGEQEVVKAIERNISKLGFEVGLRWIYVAKRERFNFVAVPSIFGVLKQFNSPALNGFVPNTKSITTVDYWFVKTRVAMRKARLFKSYKLRSYFYQPYNKFKPFIFNTTELATIFHFPGTVAGAPSMERIGAKKGAPPPNLPI